MTFPTRWHASRSNFRFFLESTFHVIKMTFIQNLLLNYPLKSLNLWLAIVPNFVKTRDSNDPRALCIPLTKK